MCFLSFFSSTLPPHKTDVVHPSRLCQVLLERRHAALGFANEQVIPQSWVQRPLVPIPRGAVSERGLWGEPKQQIIRGKQDWGVSFLGLLPIILRHNGHLFWASHPCNMLWLSCGVFLGGKDAAMAVSARPSSADFFWWHGRPWPVLYFFYRF